jgi:carbon-monoxide dehydrogenase large subunit
MLAETADVRFTADGRVVLRSGSQSNGQGHATTWAQIAAARLGIPMDRVEVLGGDSDEAPPSMPSVGSRSTAMAGSAAWVACDRAVARGRALAAHFLEAAAVDIELEDGSFRVAGTDRAIGLFDLVRQARESAGALPDGVPEDLDVAETFNAPAGTFPNGCHVCEVEIDPETGVVEVVGYTALDDVGTVINPTIVEGQIHGGVTQGLGQVLGEACVYDSAGQLLTGSFMDYAMPRADSQPAPSIGHHSVPTDANPLGAKGAGETGTTGALPAGINAVMDAMASAGVRHLDMPATPLRVWRALADARRG